MRGAGYANVLSLLREDEVAPFGVENLKRVGHVPPFMFRKERGCRAADRQASKGGHPVDVLMPFLWRKDEVRSEAHFEPVPVRCVSVQVKGGRP